MKRDVLMVDTVDRAAVMLKPIRVALIREMAEPRTCSELADVFDSTPQKMYYHVKMMERAGLVERVDERSVNGISEGIYRAKAEAYWLSPTLVRGLGGSRGIRDQASLGVLVGHAEQMLEDVGHLSDQSAAGHAVPSLSLGVEIALADGAARTAFMQDLRETFEALATRHSIANPSPNAPPESETFRFTLACYPIQPQESP